MALSYDEYITIREKYLKRGDTDSIKILDNMYKTQHGSLTPPSAQKEEEVRALLQKDPDDLTGREVKRLKELQSDPDIDMEDFLTMKEYKKLLSIIGEPKKEEPSEMSLFGHPIQFDKQ